LRTTAWLRHFDWRCRVIGPDVSTEAEPKSTWCWHGLPVSQQFSCSTPVAMSRNQGRSRPTAWLLSTRVPMSKSSGHRQPRSLDHIN
jgi:hypothetical protein